MTIPFRDDMLPDHMSKGIPSNVGNLSALDLATQPLPSASEIFDQSWNDARRVTNQNAAAVNMAEAYDDLNERIFTATKTRPINPLNAVVRPLEGNADVEDPHEEWKRQIGDLRLKHADVLPWDEILSEPERRAYAKMKEVRDASDKQQEQLGLIQGREIPYLRAVPIVREMAAVGTNLIRSPISTVAQFAGGFAGSMTSPVDAGVNLLGFGAGGAAKSLLKNAVSNAAVNAVSQMPLSYLKQEDYKKAGLPHGFDIWLSEVEGAASAGAVIDFAVRAPVRAVRALKGDKGLGGVLLDAVPDSKVTTPQGMPDIAPDTFDKARGGDLKATREIFEKTGAIDNPELRGALEHAEIYGKLDADAMARLKAMGVAEADGMRVLDGVISGRYTRPADLDADVAKIGKRAEPEIQPEQAARVLSMTQPALEAIQPGMSQLVTHALEARVAEVEGLVRSVLKRIDEPGADPGSIARTMADEVASLMRDPQTAQRITNAVRISSGAASSVDIAGMIKASPEIKAQLNPEIARHADALAIATLDDALMARVAAGDIPPNLAAHIANHIRPEYHSQAFDDMAKARPGSMAEAVALLDETIPDTPRDTAPIERQGATHVDDPTGPAAKAQVENLKADNLDAVERATADMVEREDLSSKVETLKGEIAKLEEKTAQPINDAEIMPGAFVRSEVNRFDGRTHYEIVNADGDVIGRAQAGESQGRFTVSAVNIAQPFQRQGIATALYNRIERDAGRKLEPDNTQSEAARAFWEKRRSSTQQAKNTLAEADALKLAKTRAQLAEIEPRLLELQAKTHPDPEAARALYDVAMQAVAVRRQKDVVDAVRHAVLLARQIAPAGTRIDIRTEELRDPVSGNLLDAYYQKGESTIVLASYAANPAARMSHEVVHALVDHGLLSKAEVKLLADAAAKAEGVFTAVKRQQYADAYKDRANLEALLEEEAAAHMIDAKVKGEVQGPENTISERINQFLDKLRNLVKGYGFKTADDVMAAVLNGDVARREQRLAPIRAWMQAEDIKEMAVREGGDAMFSLAGVRPGQKPIDPDLVSLKRRILGPAIKIAAAEAINLVQDTTAHGLETARGLKQQQRAMDGFGHDSTVAFYDIVVAGKKFGDAVISVSGEKAVVEWIGDATKTSGEYKSSATLGRAAVLKMYKQFKSDFPEVKQFVGKRISGSRVGDAAPLMGNSTQSIMFALADSDTGRSMRRDLDSLGYYSQALEAARALKQAKGTPEQMLAQLRSAGVKQAEIDATGLATVLDGKRSVTRDEIVAHLEANRVGLTESQRFIDPKKAERDRLRAEYQAQRRLPRDQQDAQLMAELESRIDDMMDEFAEDAQRYEPKWSAYSLDPANPTYRETVLHLPRGATPKMSLEEYWRGRFAPDADPTYVRAAYERVVQRDERDAATALSDFRSGHFPEPNIIGHMMTSMVKHEGKPTYLIDQIQSDWGQKLREEGVKDEAKTAQIKNEININFSDLSEAARTPSHPQHDAMRAFYERQDLPPQRASELARLLAELSTAENGALGNPLVNTTDQWVNTTLRRAIRQAAESDAEYIAIPSGDTVLSYNPGDENGMRQFYGSTGEERAKQLAKERASGFNLSPAYVAALEASSKPVEGIVPKNLRKLIEKLDKSAPKPISVDKLETPTAGRKGAGFTLFPLTDRIKQEVKQNGQAMFAFAGERAKTADLEALARAKTMESEGANRTQIWTDTGWFKGVDGKWRFEIDDSGLRTSIGRNALSVEHDDLARSYPYNWIDIAPDVRRSLFTQGAMGGGGPDSVAQRPLIVMGLTQRARDSVASHELQHFVQDVEGFARGGTYDDVAPAALSIGPLEVRLRLGEQYLNQAGEVEARAVQTRMDMTPEQRRARAPWLDYDVPEDQQIVRFADGSSVSQMSYSEPPPVEGYPTIKGTAMFAIRAFHGSPHDFDKFDLRKIGTGEGAQAYGHGLYFAESEGVAKSYRNKLSGPSAYDVKNPQHIAEQYLRGFSPQEASATLDSSIQQLRQFGAKPDHLEAAKKLIDDGVVTKPAGRMYEVNIKADPNDFLDWDKPLSQQSETIRSAFPQPYHDLKGEEALSALKIGARPEASTAEWLGNKKAKMSRDAIAFLNGSGSAELTKKQIAQKLREAGIPGIRYLDQGSRTAGEGSRNYVVFDDTLIEIVAKDGKAVDQAERQSVVDAMTAKPEPDKGAMFAMADQAAPEPADLLKMDYAAIDRLSQMTQLIEACRG